uniref:Serine aminopeptidase S33 domain-containing protein n=1 Tax=Rhodosorus marinus TaxID=101924 RepID=A0A7S3EFV2_9RHOD
MEELVPRNMRPPKKRSGGAFQTALNAVQSGRGTTSLASRRDAAACPLPESFSNSRHVAAIGGSSGDWSDYSAYYLYNARGQKIFTQEWLPMQSEPRGIVYMIHGLNGHSSRYQDVAKQFVESGYAVFTHDFHGHGRSEGLRGYVHSMKHLVDDAKLNVNRVVGRFGKKDIPKFILGHSLGGAVAIHLARDDKKNDWNGVMLSAPAVKVHAPNWFLKAFAPVIANLAPLASVTKVRESSNLPKRSGDRDNLIVRKPLRARVGYEILKSCENIMSNAKKFRLPVFLVHSKEDRITDPKGTVDFHESVASNDKEVRLYEGNIHDILGFPGHVFENVVKDMVEWTNEHIPLPKAS